MKTTINLNYFHDAFKRMERNKQFSYEALDILYEYLTDLEDATGEEIELDVIAICCQYCEETWQEIESAYVIDMEDIGDDDEEAKKERVKEYLMDEGVYIGETANGFVYCQH